MSTPCGSGKPAASDGGGQGLEHLCGPGKSAGLVCVPVATNKDRRLRPEDLPRAGMPSDRPICCQDSRLSQTCKPRYFEPSYCREPENMTKLVSHEYKDRWLAERREWAVKCLQKSGSAGCGRIVQRQCEHEERFVERQRAGREVKQPSHAAGKPTQSCKERQQAKPS